MEDSTGPAPDLKPGDKLVAVRRGFALGEGDTATFVRYTTGPTGGEYMTVKLDSLGSEIGYPVGTFKPAEVVMDATAPTPPCLHCKAPRDEWDGPEHAHSPCCSDDCLALAVESGAYDPLGPAATCTVTAREPYTPERLAELLGPETDTTTAPITWHGHPLPFNAYPLRPWWRWQHGKGWVRLDGRRGLGDRKMVTAAIDEYSLRHVDEMHPLPAPLLADDQLWTVVRGTPVLVDGVAAPWSPAAMGGDLLIDIETQRDMLRHWNGPQLGFSEIKPGRYSSPDGVLGTVGEFDAFANCYTFRPDGHTAPAIVGPGFPDGLMRLGKRAAGWVRVGPEVSP